MHFGGDAKWSRPFEKQAVSSEVKYKLTMTQQLTPWYLFKINGNMHRYSQ